MAPKLFEPRVLRWMLLVCSPMRQRSVDDRADLVVVRIAFRAARALESDEVVHDLLCSRARPPVRPIFGAKV